VEKAIAQAESMVSQLEAEAEKHESLGNCGTVAQLSAELDRQEIHLAVTGGKAVGKTTLIRVLESNWKPQQQQLCWKETPALFIGTDGNYRNSCNGCGDRIRLGVICNERDLTEPEFQTLHQLTAANQRTVLIFNKQDQYLPEERAAVLLSLRQRMQEMLSPEEVVGIAAFPAPVKVAASMDGCRNGMEHSPRYKTD